MSDTASSPIQNAGPLMQDRSNTPDMLNMVKQRAKQASQYYHNVGLANGNLKRDSGEFGNKRWSGSDDKRRGSTELSVPAPLTARSQPTTPVRPAPSRFGQTRVKPSKQGSTTNDPDATFDTNVRSLTFPRKIRAQDRVYESKARSSRPSAATVFSTNQNKSSETGNFFIQPLSSERRSTLPRSTSSGIDTNETRIDGNLSNRVERGESGSDYTIVYTLPNVRPRKQVPRDRMHYYETIELAPNSERGSHLLHRSKPSSLSSSPSHSPVRKPAAEGRLIEQAETIQRSSTVGNRSAGHGADVAVLQTGAFKRSKHHTVSGTPSPEKLPLPDVSSLLLFKLSRKQ